MRLTVCSERRAMQEGLEFLTQPGRWEGEGKILLPLGQQTLPFKSTWEGNGRWWVHRVYLQDVEEPVMNAYRITHQDQQARIEMESPHLGGAEGFLLIAEGQVGWEFKGDEFSGYELFRRRDDGSYDHIAEFCNPGGLQTKITGVLRWVSSEASF